MINYQIYLSQYKNNNSKKIKSHNKRIICYQKVDISYHQFQAKILSICLIGVQKVTLHPE